MLPPKKGARVTGGWQLQWPAGIMGLAMVLLLTSTFTQCGSAEIHPRAKAGTELLGLALLPLPGFLTCSSRILTVTSIPSQPSVRYIQGNQQQRHLLAPPRVNMTTVISSQTTILQGGPGPAKLPDDVSTKMLIPRDTTKKLETTSQFLQAPVVFDVNVSCVPLAVSLVGATAAVRPRYPAPANRIARIGPDRLMADACLLCCLLSPGSSAAHLDPPCSAKTATTRQPV